MHIFSPVGFDKIVPLKNGLDREVVLLIPLVQQALLNYGKFALKNPKEAWVDGGDANFLAYLQVLVEEHFLADGPADVDAAERHLVVHRVKLRGGLLRGRRRSWQQERQLPEKHKVYKVVLTAISV